MLDACSRFLNFVFALVNVIFVLVGVAVVTFGVWAALSLIDDTLATNLGVQLTSDLACAKLAAANRKNRCEPLSLSLPHLFV